MQYRRITDEILANLRRDEKRREEIETGVMRMGNVSMRVSLEIIGEKPKNGYDVFIALHGGGQSDTPFLNDSQWEIMKNYYKGSVKGGIYIAPRGIRDTWDTHFNPESYYFYKRLIENAIIFEGANPDRVYLLGYSAGGDGVYQITARMADFFAAANMSAGHPNGIDLTNVKNMPLYIQCGENDAAYNRNKETMHYAKNENVRGAFIHKGKGHQICDNGNDLQLMYDGSLTDTNAVRLLAKHTREPYPKEIVWNTDLAAFDRFYYVESRARRGIITTRREGNVFTVTGNADAIYINEDFVDFSREVRVVLNGKELIFEPKASEEVVRKTFSERLTAYSCRLNLKTVT